MFGMLLVALTLLGSCLAYPHGAPGCGKPGMQSFIPLHGNFSNSNDSLPLYVEAVKNATNWTVTLRAEGSFFKGFLLRVEPAQMGETVFGKYIDFPSKDSQVCSDTDVTHTHNRTHFTSLKFVWTPAKNYSGEVYFRASMISTFEDDFKIANSTDSLLKADSAEIVPDPECGSIKGCYSSCTNSSCTYLITWRRRGDIVRFEMMIDIAMTIHYQAIAFSGDQIMGNDSVMVCKSTANGVTFELGYNTGKFYSPLSNQNRSHVMVISTSRVGNITKCVIDRPVTTSDGKLFNLTKPWYLLRAVGPLYGGSAVGAHAIKFPSDDRFDFLLYPKSTQIFTSSTASPDSSSKQADPDKIVPDPECDSTKGCYASCTNTSCTYLITWRRHGDIVRFEMMIDIAMTIHYQAIAFSGDQIMGNDSVLVCKSTANGVTFELGYNTGKFYSPLSSQDKSHVVVISTSRVGNITKCIIDRPVTSSDGKQFNLTKSWYLLRAVGPLYGGSAVGAHAIKFPSDNRFDFLLYPKSTQILTSSTTLPDSSSKQAGDRIVPNPECDSSKGCFSDCSTTSCSYMITWKRTGDTIRFEMIIDIANEIYYQAIAFSDDKIMGNDSVMVCKSGTGSVTFELGYNTGKQYSSLLNQHKSHVKVVSTSRVGNITECVVDRPITSTDAKLFNLSSSWYLLRAVGPLYGNFIGFHAIKFPSIRRFDFLSPSLSIASTTASSKSSETQFLSSSKSNAAPETSPKATQTPVSIISADLECGSSKGCSSDCVQSSCSFQFTWQKRGDIVRFEMMEDSGAGDHFQALGLSVDDKMMPVVGAQFETSVQKGEDSVMVCKSIGGKSVFELGYNKGKQYSPLPNQDIHGIRIIEVSKRGTISICVIERSIQSKDDDVFQLSQPWYLLRASGPLFGNDVKFHTKQTVSQTEVDFLSASIAVESFPDNLLVKLHGSLMIVAWILFSSVGIVTARHLKNAWNEKTLGGKQVWFQIHRTCMVLVFLCTVAAFVIIFIHVGGYREIIVTDDRDYLKTHPFLGITVTCLTVINPIMALFRPDPTSKRRPVFNAAHFLVGVSAHVISAVTILFGMSLNQAGLPAKVTYIIYGYMSTFVLIEFVFEVFRCAEINRTQVNDVTLKMTNLVQEKEKEDDQLQPPKSKRKESLLYLHILLMIGFCVALLIYMIQA